MLPEPTIPHLGLRVEASPGATFLGLAESLVLLSRRLGIQVWCLANDVQMFACPEDDAVAVIARFHLARQRVHVQ